MSNKLLIMESATKAKTVAGILGAEYTVEATNGHVRELPEKGFGIDIENGFAMQYQIPRSHLMIVQMLKKKAKAADVIYLASDPDREGEAIAWHLTKCLDFGDKPVYRVTFNEITKKGIMEGMQAPREINQNLVDASLARRSLDRIVGYKLSPLLWKIKKNLSAGRVQSVAQRIICDREDEINAFVPEEYWTIKVNLRKNGENDVFEAAYYGENGKKAALKNKEKADKILADIEGLAFTVSDVKQTEKKQSPFAPYTTSTLQQDAAHKLNLSAKETMHVAQDLYEGIRVEGFGMVGLITYIRTDSVRISESAQNDARNYIENKYGSAYVPAKKRFYKNKNGAQDAHEAIRPTHMDMDPDLVKNSLSTAEYKLYKLIFDRFIASQMADMVYDQTTIVTECGSHTFKTTGSVVKFKGFSAQYRSVIPQEENVNILPRVEISEELESSDYKAAQHFTEPPPRYNEASLIKTLEELGIGRPSTYAKIIGTIQSRDYVKTEKKVFYPTELGQHVNRLLKEHFSDIVDVKFTANVESELDNISEGKIGWIEVIENFYNPFEEELEAAAPYFAKAKIPAKETGEICELCGKPLVYRNGPKGQTFIGCSGFPECRFTKNIVKEVGKDCPECGGKLIYRYSKQGTQFVGCENYPTCSFSMFYVPTGEKCPKCGGYLVYKQGRGYRKYIACVNKDCGYVPSAERKKKTVSVEKNEDAIAEGKIGEGNNGANAQ